MKITAKASGGFAGRSECYELDTSCHADGKSVEALLRRLDFFRAAPPFAIGADIPRWEVTVDDGPRHRTVVLQEDGSAHTADWHRLLEHLRRSA